MDAVEGDVADADTGPLVVTLTGPRRVEVQRTPRALVPPGHVRIRTLYSGISAGTLRAAGVDGA
jgi:hypothetical protein